MSATRALSLLLIPAALITLAACGSGTHVINCVPPPLGAASISTCTCGGNGLHCPAPLYLLATNSSGQVSTFSIDLGTGALTNVSTVSNGPTVGLGFTQLDTAFVYASDLQHASVYAWAFAFPGGTLTPVSGSPFVLGSLNVVGGLAASQTQRILYVADAGKVDALQSDITTGVLTPLPNSPFTSGTNVFLTVDLSGQFLFTAIDDPPGGVFAFTIDQTTGSLTAVPGSPFAADPTSINSTQPGQIVADYTDNFVFTPLHLTNQVAAFSINKPAGTLVPVPGSPFAAGNGPFSVVAARNFLYVSNVTDGTISGYSIDPTTGILTPLANSPFSIVGGSLVTDSSYRFLYATSNGTIQAFTIDPNTGNLTPIAGSPFSAPSVALLAVAP